MVKIILNPLQKQGIVERKYCRSPTRLVFLPEKSLNQAALYNETICWLLIGGLAGDRLPNSLKERGLNFYSSASPRVATG
jgi:hypothetical protein